MAHPTPFYPSFDRSEVDRMLAKVKDTRLPDGPIIPGTSWDYGIDLAWLKDLKTTWETEWSYDALEKKMTSFPHFRTDIEDLSIHFIHVKSSQPEAIPLLLVHGWPSSWLEFVEVIDELANPSTGGVAFNVIVPSLPGYFVSEGPKQTGFAAKDVARLFNTLMTDILGYKTYSTSAGDWGTAVTQQLLNNHPESAKVGNFNMLFTTPPFTSLSTLCFALSYLPLPRSIVDWFASFGLTEGERRGLARGREFKKSGSGYQDIQGTRPMTLGCALYDHPVGILSWIGEKFYVWSDQTAPHPPCKMDATHILNQASLYHLTKSIHTSFLPYKDYRGGKGNKVPDFLDKLPKTTPVGFSVYPFEIATLPRAWYEKAFNIVQWREHSHGGHFAPVQSPETYVADVRTLMGKHFPR